MAEDAGRPDTDLSDEELDDIESLDDEVSDPPLQPLAYDGPTVEGPDMLLRYAARYGKYYNEDRALPDIRDGLKPGQRRILYAMMDQGYFVHRKHKKSIATVGYTLQHFHPHGDQAVYDTMVRMAQGFVNNLPLVDGRGNFGSPGPKEFSDPAAANRYTEARLSEAGTALSDDLKPEIVDFVPNFSEERTEPSVLPVPFPNLLVNGTAGIGWGLAGAIPPHNLREAIDAAILLAEKPETTLEQILKKMPGPDFPTKGVLVAEDLTEIYRTGRGTCKLQGRWHTERNTSGKEILVITELPHGVSARQIKAQLQKAWKDGKLTETNVKPLDRSDGKRGIRVEIDPKRGANMGKLVAQVRKYSSVEDTVSFNFTVLVDGVPKSVGLMQILQSFVDFRQTIVIGRLEREKSQLLRDLHRLGALRGALDVIDRVIKIIRTTEGDDDTVKQALMDVVKFQPYDTKRKIAIDAEQAEYIMSMQLRRLSALNAFKIDEQIADKTARVTEIDRLLSTPEEITAIYVGELREARKKFGRDRQTPIAGADMTTVDDEPLGGASIPRTDVWLWAGSDGRMLATMRDGKDPKRCPLALDGHDLVTMLPTDTDAEVLAVATDGMAYRIRVAELGVATRAGKGASPLPKGTSIVGVVPAESDDQPFLLFVGARGLLKRMPLDALTKIGRDGGVVAAFGDEPLMGAVAHAEQDEILLAFAQGNVLRTPMAALGPKKTPSAGGVGGPKLADGDRIISAQVAAGDHAVTFHVTGMARVTPLAEYPAKGRTSAGVQSAKVAAPAKAPAGEVASVVCAAGDTLHARTRGGELVHLKISDLPAGRRATNASPTAALALGPGDVIIAPLP